MTAFDSFQRRKKRLLREARAAAKLDHPNICAIHEVAEEDSRSFIVMQYVEGETLASRVQRKPLEWFEALGMWLSKSQMRSQKHMHTGNPIWRSRAVKVRLGGLIPRK